jgi:hypothetical protein
MGTKRLTNFILTEITRNQKNKLRKFKMKKLNLKSVELETD